MPRAVVVLVQVVAAGYAAYAFATVPIGRRTSLEHIRAILATPPAKQAADEMSRAAGRAADAFRAWKPHPPRDRARRPR